jgi:hypothetical protein
MMLVRYLANLNGARLVLWCYFTWYLVVLVRYFDSNLRLWMTSLGLSAIIGIALYLSTTKAGKGAVKLGTWQTIRLFMMPFCVSSFSALVKGKGFVLIFSPNPMEILVAVGICVALCGTVFVLKRMGVAEACSMAKDLGEVVGSDEGQMSKGQGVANRK